MLKEKIGFIGAGKMGSALIRSILEKRLVSSENLWVCDKIAKKLSFFSERGVNTSVKIKPMIKRVDVIFIAVEPQHISKVLEILKNEIRSSQLIVSIAAGITTSYIRQKLTTEVPIVRVMPNSPALIGEGISAISPSRGTNAQNIRIVKEILGAAKMAKESGISLDELRRSVVSPGGTTSEGLKVLEKGEFKSCLVQAVVRGSERARELRK